MTGSQETGMKIFEQSGEGRKEGRKGSQKDSDLYPLAFMAAGFVVQSQRPPKLSENCFTAFHFPVLSNEERNLFFSPLSFRTQ